MSAPIIGMIVSGSCILLFTLLFKIEKNRGTRIAHRLRLRLDYVVLRMRVMWDKSTQYLGSDWIRQTFHYLFHTVLQGTISFLTRLEKGLRKVLKVNRVRARKARIARSTRNKLDEIAEHKALVALSETEKKRHKEKSLNG